MSIFGDLRKAGINYNNGVLEFVDPVVFEAGHASKQGRGNAYYVDSVNGSANSQGISPKNALATIDQAINKCTANQGDVIYVLSGHTETISAATSLVADVAGITIVGLGRGSARPKLSFSAAAASIPVSAANVTFRNLVFEAAFADVAEVFTPSATYLTVENCTFQAAASAQNFLSLADTGTTDNECDGLTFRSCEWIEPDLQTLAMVSVDGDLDKLTVEDCYVNLGVNTSDLPCVAIVATGKDVTNVRVKNNQFIRLNDANPLLITADTTTANTGVVSGNHVRHLDIASELLVTAGTNIGFFENYATAAVDASGYLLPAADS